VTNSDKLTSSVKHTITIGAAASPPKAAISGPSSGTENQAVSFDGSKSAPGSGSITSYAWDFGDGSSGSGAQVSHTYTKAGKYAVILTVTNSDKLTNQAKHGITIAAQQQQQQKQQQQQQSSNPHPPTAVISGSSSGKVGKSISFSAKGSQPGSGSKKITQEVWSFGDGGTASGAHVSHKYSAPGTYTVTLTVTNDKNLTSSATRSVTIS
jgi:PKD repeat protein